MAERTTSWQLHGLHLTDHVVDVPLDHTNPDGRTIEVFARVVAADGGTDRPFLVYLQGGPGQESPRPSVTPSNPSWLKRALQDYRVVLLDQRGTGLSTPYGGAPTDPAADAEYLSHFRADAIVADAEALRQHLGARRWSLLGQSFGGFCSLHYLSRHPERLSEVYITGGLPPVGRHPDEVYAATYARMRTLTDRHFARFPGDRDRLSTAVAAAGAGTIRMADGAPVSARRLQGLGYQLGMDGGSDALHYLLERPWRRRPSSPTWPGSCRSPAGTRSTPSSMSPAMPMGTPPGGRPNGRCPTTSARTRPCSPVSTCSAGTSASAPTSRRTGR